MKSILMTNSYSEFVLKTIHDLLPPGFSLMNMNGSSDSEIKIRIAEADYLLAGGRMQITREILDEAKDLKMIQRSGVGLDSLDLDAIREKGIPLYVNSGINAESVAEHTLLLMLACLRQLTIVHRNTAKGVWKKQEQGIQTRELRGKTVGIIGMGSAARALVCLLQPFRARLLYYDPLRQEEAFERRNGLKYCRMEDLLAQSDIVTLHCSLSEDTRELINPARLSRMKDGAILINTARGGLIQSEALAEALKSGKLAFAGLDAHDPEPLSGACPYLNLERVILTPHIAGVTADSFAAMMQSAFRNIRLFDEGRTEEIQEYRYL